jgi:multicomponent Na+:H+ antiporter subunit D
MDLVPLTIAVPLLAAAVLAALVPLHLRRTAELSSIAVAAAVAVLCVLVLADATDGPLVYWFGGWEPRDEVAIGISFVVDEGGAGMAGFAALVTVAALVYAVRSLEIADELFHLLMLVFMAGMVGFALSGDLFTSFVFFELMTVSAFVLAGYNVEQRTPLEGSLNFAITNTVGSFLFLLGVGLVYGRTGALNLAQVGEALAGEPADGLVVVAFGLIASGFFVKAAVVPFHFWLADAYAVARTPVCIMLAAAMSELGLYGLARVYWTAFEGALAPGVDELRAVLLAAGAATALVGALMALVQTHLKRLLAFATIAYIGLLLVGVGLFSADGLAGAAVFVLGDGLIKASLFACVGIVQHRRGHVEVRRLYGLGRELRFTAALFAVGALAVASLPPFGSFLGKSLIEHAAVDAGHAWAIALFLAVPALVGAAILRAGAEVFLGLGPRPRSTGEEDEPEEAEREQEEDRTPATMFVPAAALLVGSLAVGLWPDLPSDALGMAERFVDRQGYAGATLSGIVPPTPPAATAGPHWYDWLVGLLTAAAATGLAGLMLARRRLPGLAEPARVALARLRALHSGHPGDYVAWLAAGAAALGGLFALSLA